MFLRYIRWMLWTLLTILELLWEMIAGVFGIPPRSTTFSALVMKAKKATTYDEWIVVSRQLDELEGFRSWCLKEEPRRMNVEGLVGYIQLLTGLKKKGDTSMLLSALSTGIQRFAFGITNPRLYVYRTGTKTVIEMYNSLLVYLIHSLVRESSMENSKKYSTLVDLARVCGNTSLVFRGGLMMGAFHIGIARALWGANLLPRVFSGERAGAIAASLLCCKTNLADLFDRDVLDYTAFGDANFGFFDWRWQRFWNEGHFLDIRHIVQFMKDNIGELTFLEAYQLTGRVLNIDYVPEVVKKTNTAAPPVRSLNYLTAPNVIVYSAAAAALATMPLIFERYPLLARDLEGRIVPYDSPLMGSVGNRTDGKIDGLRRLRELFHVNYFIISDCSTIRLFLQLFEHSSILARLAHSILQECWRFLLFIVSFTPLQKYIWVFFSSEEDFADDVMRLFPLLSVFDIVSLLQLPGMTLLQECVLCGERRVWPSLERIREHIAAELALDDVLSELRQMNPTLCCEDDNSYL